MFIRIAVPVTLYADIEIPSVNLPEQPLHLAGDDDIAEAAIDDINAKLQEYLSREDDEIPEGEWIEVDRQDEIKRELGPLARSI